MLALNRVIFKAQAPFDRSDTEYQLTPVEIDNILRKATMTEWFINPVQGQPRYVDIYRLRSYARSEWVATVVNYLLNRVKVIQYEIVAKDPTKRANPSARIQEEIRKAMKLFESCTSEGKSYKSAVEPMFLRDILEIDAGVVVKAFTKESYIGNPLEPNSLKMRYQRSLAEFQAFDGGSFLKDINTNLVLKGYWQYSYTRPSAKPVFFNPDEICYGLRYPRSYNPYGWAPTQNADAIVTSLINSAVWNSNFFAGEGIPKGMITIDGDDNAVKRFRAYWRNKIKGRWYSMPVVNRDAKWVPFSLTAQDMEWLSGQKWYQRLICSLYQVHPSEVGIEDTSRQAGAALEKRDMAQKRSSIVPLLLLLEENLNRDIISEISPRIIIRYTPEDPEEAETKAKMENEQVIQGIKTINQVRVSRGEPPVAWGNIPPALLNNFIRSFSKFGRMPTLEEMESMDFSDLEPPKPQFNPMAQEIASKSVKLDKDLKTKKLEILAKIAEKVN